ncbi:MAG: response regulator transcription factor [Verrucomicrobiia bacterium]
MPVASGVMKQTPTSPSAPDNFPRPLCTLVVDDSFRFLRALCAYLKTEPMFEVVGTAVGGGEALHMAAMLGPDLVLMDLHMPVMDGLQATAILCRAVPNIRIIIMTMEDSAAAEAEAQAHGAHGFIGKPRITHDLITEVRRVFHSDHTKGRAEQLVVPSRSAFTTGPSGVRPAIG